MGHGSSGGKDAGLVGHWVLDGDCADHSGHGNDAVNRGADLSQKEGAAFSRRSGHLEVPDSASLRLGGGDFSVAVSVHTDRELDDVLGDIVGKYDPATRTGFNFCIQNFHGVTSAQSNYRNVFFGIDAGRLDASWSDCGRPGACVMVWALCVHEGQLYAGTFEMGKEQSGHVYRYDGGTRWIDCGSPHSSNAVTSLAVFEGKLYAAVSHYRSGGSALADSENTTFGGRVFRYEGGTRWADCGRLGEIEAVGGMAVFQGRLYASSMYAPAGLYRYEGGAEWSCCGNPGGRVEALAVYGGNLYGSGWDLGRSGVYRFDGPRCCGGARWTDCGTPPNVTQTYSFAIHRGRVYIGTWPGGKVFRYAGGETWEDCGRLGDEEEVMAMAAYNGKLYAGTLPLAQVYRYDGDGAWTPTGRLDVTPDVKYRRVWSMAVYQGKLFAGTLPSGRVFAIEAGKSVTHDHELAPGWQHLAAVRHGDRLHLYVNGKAVATSTPFQPRDFDLANGQPLTIGFGAHDYFHGRIRDLRMYSRALSAEEVKRIKG